MECNVNTDCSTNRACIQNHCMDPCLFDNVCAPTAICSTANHIASCACPPGYVGNPQVSCSPKGPPLPVETEEECQIDSDCPSGRACLDHTCRNPCFELSPCASTAICSVVDTTPFRTMICSCREGWIPGINFINILQAAFMR